MKKKRTPVPPELAAVSPSVRRHIAGLVLRVRLSKTHEWIEQLAKLDPAYRNRFAVKADLFTLPGRGRSKPYLSAWLSERASNTFNPTSATVTARRAGATTFRRIKHVTLKMTGHVFGSGSYDLMTWEVRPNNGPDPAKVGALLEAFAYAFRDKFVLSWKSHRSGFNLVHKRQFTPPQGYVGLTKPNVPTPELDADYVLRVNFMSGVLQLFDKYIDTIGPGDTPRKRRKKKRANPTPVEPADGGRTPEPVKAADSEPA